MKTPWDEDPQESLRFFGCIVAGVLFWGWIMLVVTSITSAYLDRAEEAARPVVQSSK